MLFALFFPPSTFRRGLGFLFLLDICTPAACRFVTFPLVHVCAYPSSLLSVTAGLADPVLFFFFYFFPPPVQRSVGQEGGTSTRGFLRKCHCLVVRRLVTQFIQLR